MALLKLPFVNMVGIVLRMLLLIGVCLVSEYAIGQTELPEPLSPPRLVNDFASLMQPVDVEALEQKLVLFSDCTSNQVSIVTVETIGDYEVADFAQRLGQKWGIGKKDKNNGVLILISKTERKMTIQTGFGLEGVLPDYVCARIIEDKLKPNFKEGNYYYGLYAGVNEIILLTKEEYQADKDNRIFKGGIPVWVGLLAGFILFVIFMVIGKRKKRGGYSNFRNASGLFSRSGGGWSGGSGSSRSGGFGGFGGGSFGGGGASGSW